MKTWRFALLLLLALAFTTGASANLDVPKAKVAGETVHVRMEAKSALVTAILEFEPWEVDRDKVAYFPIMAGAKDDPKKVLAAARFEMILGGRFFSLAKPAAPPERFRAASAGPRICWFAVHLDAAAVGAAADGANHRIKIRVSYQQPFVDGKFYYLPILSGREGRSDTPRTWDCPMFVSSGLRVTQVLSANADFEPVADGVVVYLKDGVMVELR